jgi:4-amino-4-deoxy-L-arabinose transferase-like glycosyltransferase
MAIRHTRMYRTGFLSAQSFVVLLFCLTVGLRLVGVVATFKGNDKVVSWEDVAIAKNLLEGKGYSIDNMWRNRMIYGNLIRDVEDKIGDPLTEGYRPTTLKQPVFPFLLTAVFYVFGFGNFLALFIVHSILAGLTAITLFLALRTQSERIAAVFALGFAVYPPFIYQCATSPESTIVLLFLLSLFFYQAVCLQESPKLKRFALLGAIAGAMVMTNPGALVFTMLSVCFIAFIVSDKYLIWVKQVIVSLVIFSIVVSPWFIRNYIMFERLIVRAETGHELLKSRYEAGYDILISDEILLGLEKQGRVLSEVEEGEMLIDAISTEVRRDLVMLGHGMLMNLFHFWWEPPRYHNDYSLLYTMGRRIPYYILLVLSIPTIIWSLIQSAQRRVAYMKHHVSDCMAILLIVADTAVFSYIGGWNIRYHFPIECVMLLFAAQTTIVLYDGVSGVALHKKFRAFYNLWA